MATVDDTPRTYDEAVRTLASWHADEQGNGMEVYSIPDPSQAVVRLIEVSDEFPCMDSAHPFVFGRSADFPFKSSVLQITPEQWRRALNGKLELPRGWDLSSRRRVHP